MILDDIVRYISQSAGDTVTLRQVQEATALSCRPVLWVLDRLAREGYLVQVGDCPVRPAYGEIAPPRRDPTWRVVSDPAGRPVPNPPRAQSMRSRIWRAVRAKRRFTKRSLAIVAGASADSVDEYVRVLERHGYVRRTGKDGRLVVYILIRPRQVSPPVGLFGGRS